MSQTIEVLIAIQARATSQRFPKKIYEMIGRNRMLDHVVNQARSVADHIMRHTTKLSIRCSVAILHPDNDAELSSAFKSGGVMMISGPEQDVLSRYVKAQKLTAADYVVRLTSDCPLILDFVVSKHIHIAAFNGHDYVSNVEPLCRSVADGFDCEVISKKALEWLDKNATTAEDREHVTTALRRVRPPEIQQAFISSKIDTSSMKMSVDTPEDLDRIRSYFHEREHKTEIARKLFGKHVYEL